MPATEQNHSFFFFFRWLAFARFAHWQMHYTHSPILFHRNECGKTLYTHTERVAAYIQSRVKKRVTCVTDASNWSEKKNTANEIDVLKRRDDDSTLCMFFFLFIFSVVARFFHPENFHPFQFSFGFLAHFRSQRSLG